MTDSLLISDYAAVSSFQASVPGLLNLVEQFIRRSLQAGDIQIRSTSYEAVYDACKTIVVFAHEGKRVADTLERSLKQCAISIMNTLKSSKVTLFQWLEEYNKLWSWYTRRLVSISLHKHTRD